MKNNAIKTPVAIPVSKLHPFEGHPYCADCGAKLSFCAAKKLSPNQEHYRCSNYKSNHGQCQVHFIREVSLQKIVLKAIQDLSVFVQEFEPVFLYLMDRKSNKERNREITRLGQTVKDGRKRIEEIDRIISRLYEDNISGKISDERYIKLADGYESEQKALAIQLSDDEKELTQMEQNKNDLRLLLQTLRKCTDITELNRDLVNRLIQRIDVHNNDKYDGHNHVKVDIYFTGVGIINIPTEQEILKLIQEIRNSRPNEQIL